MKISIFLLIWNVLFSIEKIVYILPHVGDHFQVFINPAATPQESGKLFYCLKQRLEKKGSILFLSHLS